MRDQGITYEQARDLLSAPSGQRPRIYGQIAAGQDSEGQIVAIRSDYYLDKYTCERIWLSGTTLSDLVSRA